jgi:hypothetical protein
MPISDGSLWQTLILNELRIPYIAMTQRGTVSASALDLAFTLSDNEVFIAGIDLANRDIRSHARPYSLDRFMEEKAERINPVYSQIYKRSSLLKEGGSYDIYASWFKKQLKFYPKRLHSLGKNSGVFSSLETTMDNRIENTPVKPSEGQAKINFYTIAGEGNYSRKAYAVLEKALNNKTHSEVLQKELKPLLLQCDTSPDKPIIENLIKCIDAIRREGKDG